MIAILSCAAVMAFGSPATALYDFTMKNIDGKEKPLAEYKGKVVMVVNVASKCGLTPQYKELEALYKEKKDAGFVILGFPANEFGNQEPGTNAEIKEFCEEKYGVTFPMFEKIVVKGPQIHPLYTWLIAETGGQEIGWNFTKFLIGRDGKVIRRFPPQMTPQTKDIRDAVEAALAAK
ncbi:MAG: glutathione peroxidase [Fimbriimonadaceae bacterium]